MSRSTWYHNMNALKRVDCHAELKNKISEIYHYHKGRYGYRRITLTLRKQGLLVNHKTVQRLMAELSLRSLIRIKKYRSCYSLSERPVMEMVNSMLRDAFSKLSPEDTPLLHSDQGWQYRIAGYQAKLNAQGVTQSMSRKGNCLDNAVMENFFGTLKSECFYLNQFSSLAELRKAIEDYIQYYNNERISLKLQGLSPVEYRTQDLKAA